MGVLKDMLENNYFNLLFGVPDTDFEEPANNNYTPDKLDIGRPRITADEVLIFYAFVVALIL